MRFAQSNVPPVAPIIRRVFKGPLILNSDYDGPRAQEALNDGGADAIAFGRAFLPDPDLSRRSQDYLAFTEGNVATRYTRGPKG
ncbi:hypothetical protein M8523_28440 [Hyphomicrobiales bacterium BP6-180914]|uniref:NADH:flavin oxidoreductase/NADH oxidase N-terminal domain-containing protein n=1 Tax=Lichenifustis flavocetrariae TaxID=2949735 RepID=A0AA41Z2P9_9HYPH|nr:hypothetical protein [Lichenifustis flavocetrariae]MCW6511891.1 hypothetical protein [Lichenifustis flavocetrariae]